MVMMKATTISRFRPRGPVCPPWHPSPQPGTSGAACGIPRVAPAPPRRISRGPSSRGSVVARDSRAVTNADGGEGPQCKTPLTDRLYSYLLHHTRELPLLAKLREETAGMHGAQMQIPPEQGPFMALLTEISGTKRAIEVGVFTGYSSLAVAMALPEDGQLFALDKDAASMDVARRYWKEAGVYHKIEERCGDGIVSLETLLDDGAQDTFDMAFIDANKRGYIKYYELLLQLVRPGGLIIADNVLFYGKVADNEVQDKFTQALRDFNSHVLEDDRVSLSIIPVGDGMALCRRRH